MVSIARATMILLVMVTNILMSMMVISLSSMMMTLMMMTLITIISVKLRMFASYLRHMRANGLVVWENDNEPKHFTMMMKTTTTMSVVTDL